MFSSNERLSGRQVSRLLGLELFGEGALVLPVMAGPMGGREFLLSLGLVSAGLLLLTLRLERLVVLTGGVSRAYLTERLGRGSTRLLSLLAGACTAVNLIVLAVVFGEFGRSLVLTEARSEVLRGMLLLAGFMGALGQGETRGRLAAVWYPLLFWPLLVLFLVSAMTVRPGYFIEELPRAEQTGLRQLLGLSAVFCGLSARFFLEGRNGNPGGHGRVRGMAVTLVGLLVLFALQVGSFGEGAVQDFAWPAAALMSSARLPGGFLERWDVIFACLLLFMLFVTAASDFAALFYLAERLLPGRSVWMRRLLTLGVIGLLAELCPDQVSAGRLLFAVNGVIGAPVLWMTVLLLLYLERRRGAVRR